LNNFTPDSVRRSIEPLKRAISTDPGYAPAYASLAEAYQQLPVWTEATPSSTFPLALEAAEHALRLNPDLPDAHASLGLIHATYHWNWEEADRRFRRALALNPGCSSASQWYAEFLAEMGRFEEAMAITDAALVYDPLSRAMQSTRAFVLWMAHRFDEAIDQAEAVLDTDPAYPMALIRLGVAHAGKGEYRQAVRALRRATAAAPELPAGHGVLGYACGLAGDQQQALAVLDRLGRMREGRYVPSFPFAMVHLGLGDWDNAVRYMEEEYEHRGWFLVLLNKAPQFAPLRGHPRFDALVRRLNFPS
jgi:serine/threonine-protein kinase